ncbi:fluoride efflux transporter CrcB [Photobacterium leiognathi]|uniref:fluoride efflux transporter CrcB n=1 Tax=Photobacterium leiognathi TaxID=553611 RepID=UPI00076AD4DF|nr:fluoride efflux transporter CrcB [Photobacterium leiognathi]
MIKTLSNLSLMWVGIGGGIGAALRYKVGNLISHKYQGEFPLSTFIVNISGAFIIAFISVLFGVDSDIRLGTIGHELFLTGILGGYTTFSSMQLDALKLFEKGKKVTSVFYLFITFFAGVVGATSGIWLANKIICMAYF